MRLWITKYMHKTKEIVMKTLYKTQLSTINQYLKNIIGKILETYNGTMYFK